MKPKKSEQADNQDKATKLKMPAVAMGAWGRVIRSSMPHVTSEEAREQTLRTRAITDRLRAEMIAARGDRPPKCTLEMEIKKTPNL